MRILRHEFSLRNNDVMNSTELETYLKQHGRYVIQNPDMDALVFKCPPEDISKYRQYERCRVNIILAFNGADVTLCGSRVDPENKYYMEFHINRYKVDDDGRVELFPYQLVFTLRDDEFTKIEYIQEEV